MFFFFPKSEKLMLEKNGLIRNRKTLNFEKVALSETGKQNFEFQIHKCLHLNFNCAKILFITKR